MLMWGDFFGLDFLNYPSLTLRRLLKSRGGRQKPRAPGGAAPAGPHQWRAWGARTRRHAARRREQARAEPCDHGKSPSRAISRARSVSRLQNASRP